ncbi:hypothetical protein [Brevibacillus reuszeri]|uniref:hypothetical protein n=1 Tax=Brevibacillus reuszeri TaxID=54915 RepID=UPI000CCBFB2B|nr:hypothetical protein [Brevibacillus reuszeri]
MKKSELIAEQERLMTIANELARKHWGIDYAGTLTLVDRPWRAYNGRYFWRADHSRQEIRMSVRRNAERTPEDVERTLLHELVHWRLQTTGIPHRDTDYEFIAECLRVGASISKARAAQDAYKRYMTIRVFEQQTGRKYEEVSA